MFRIKQSLDCARLEDIDSAVREEIRKSGFLSSLKLGRHVAITAGSRGITDIVRVLTSLVDILKEAGAYPFIIPSMGSHGGASAEGQLSLLKEYGVTEQVVRAPIRSSMDVVQMGSTPSGIPVFIDKIAAEADRIIVVNRIKPHTEFHGRIESGLIKMVVIGMGKHRGAIVAHQYAVKYGYEETLREIGKVILEKAPIGLGIGIIENGYGETARIAAICPEHFFEMEERLLEEARMRKPKLPFDKLDILIINECGKEISGTGLETKVVGRIMNIYEPELNHPRITRIIVRDLTEKTHGNATGIGIADFITQKAFEKIDLQATGINCITAVTPEKARLPVVCNHDNEAIDFALATSGPVDGRNVRLVWIKNTSCLDELWVSEALLSEVRSKENVEVDGQSVKMGFDGKGNLIDVFEKGETGCSGKELDKKIV